MLGLMASSAGAAFGAPASPLPHFSPAEWSLIARDARRRVAAESPASAFPFRTSRAGASGPLVIAHYFLPFPLSIDGAPAATDYYATQYLRPEGENGKFRVQRGYLRERPLPGVTRPAARFVATNLGIEVARAARIGIDAFGIDLLTIAPESPLWANTRLMLDVAHRVAPDFRIVPEPDMAMLGQASVAEMAAALARFADHPAAYRLADGRLLVMPLGAGDRGPAYWSALARAMAARGTPIALLFDYIDAAPMAAHAPLSWGASIWGDRDPRAGAVALAMRARARGAGIAHWFMPVAPQDARPKDGLFIEARNSEAFRAQWQTAIASGSTGVHLLTWNDYSETTEIAPSSFTQFLFYDLTAYYIAWLKQGRPPTISRDALYYVQRRQILDPADTRRGPGPLLRGGTPMANDVELVALLTRPAMLAIDSGGRTAARAVPAGLQTLRIPAAIGRPGFALWRGGRRLIALRSGWSIAAAPAAHDATYGGGSSTRALATVPGEGRP